MSSVHIQMIQMWALGVSFHPTWTVPHEIIVSQTPVLTSQRQSSLVKRRTNTHMQNRISRHERAYSATWWSRRDQVSRDETLIRT